jgi:hypothetical protein
MTPIDSRRSERQTLRLQCLAFLFCAISAAGFPQDSITVTGRPKESSVVPKKGDPLPMPRLGKGESLHVDHWHNNDGSTRYSIEFGAGPSFATGATANYVTNGGVVAAAFGLNLNRRVALQARGEYDQFGVPGRVLAAYGQPDGRVQIASATLNTILRYHVGSHMQAYVTGGGGYYRRVTRFVTPSNSTVCIGGSCLTGGGVTNGFFVNNTAGGNGGFGFEWKPSFYSNQKIFAEVRYNFLLQQDPTAAGSVYIQNSRNAQYVPVLVGLRW